MRHEKVVLIVLSYIIGFTTAYIGFGLSNIDTPAYNRYIGSDLASFSASTKAQEAYAGEPLSVIMNDRGMFVTQNGEEIVVSGKLQEGIVAGQGFHVAIPFYKVSPTGAYVYYCEQETAQPDSCQEYIYVVAEHSSHPLQISSNKLSASSHASGNFAWTDTDIATYDAFISESQSKPWKLIQKN
ncbi:hypothetical protein N8083_00330 [Candidatus Pacebacteria bacterium]|nr:hypothetical protein [Candidatus Paceibacterota bacterium]